MTLLRGEINSEISEIKRSKFYENVTGFALASLTERNIQANYIYFTATNFSRKNNFYEEHF